MKMIIGKQPVQQKEIICALFKTSKVLIKYEKKYIFSVSL